MQGGGGALSVWQKSPDFRSLEVGISGSCQGKSTGHSFVLLRFSSPRRYNFPEVIYLGKNRSHRQIWVSPGKLSTSQVSLGQNPVVWPQLMIFQLSDWFPKAMICAIIVKFDQMRKNWWRISCAEILKVGKIFFAASSVKKMSRFEEVSPEKNQENCYGLVGYIYQLISGASSKNNCLIFRLVINTLPICVWLITMATRLIF